MDTISSFDYSTLEERDAIIAAHPDLTLIEERNLFSGNTLVFSDMADEKHTKFLENQSTVNIDGLKSQNADIIFALVSNNLM